MHFQHIEDKRKQKRKYLRLKIITNRDFNFITAIRPEATVTDLANRALNVYLELCHQNRTKKQLTVSAVKQGRFFMPKSEIVSNLLSQDEEVQIIIVKAKPKFPEQHIPTQHDFEVLAKKIKNFDEIMNKKSNLLASKQKIMQQQKLSKQNSKAQSAESSQLSDNEDSSKKSKRSQVQRSKRERKKQKRNQKNQLPQKQQNDTNKLNDLKDQSERKITEQTTNTFKLSVPTELNRKQENLQKGVESRANEIGIQPNIDQIKIVSAQLQQIHKQKKDTEPKVQSAQSIKSDHRAIQNIKREFPQLVRNQNSEQKLQEPIKKIKIDQNNRSGQQELSRKGSVDNRSEKTPKVNPVQSPKIVFHFESKHESPKVIYIPESRTMSEMKQNIEKQKQKMRTMSPLMLPKSSPKISFATDPLEKSQQNSKNVNKKGKEIVPQRKGSISNDDQPNGKEGKKEKQQFKMQRQVSPKQSSVNQVDQKRNNLIQPQIIEEESSEEEVIVLPQNRGSSSVQNSKQSQKSNVSQSHSEESYSSTIKKKSSTASRFFQIENMMRKFQLEESDQDEN